MLAIGTALLIFTSTNERYYRNPVAKIEQTTITQHQSLHDEFNNTDQQIQQKIRARILNGRYKNHQIILNNAYTKSQGMSHRYSRGQLLILNPITQQQGRLSSSIVGLKRDRLITMLLWLVMTILVLSMQRAGWLALLGVLINTGFLIIMIKVNNLLNGNQILLIASLAATIFTLVSLTLILGTSKKMLATLIATLGGTLLSVIVGVVVLKVTNNKGVLFETLDYATQQPIPLFIAETILGSLGAVMDEASDIMATLYELKSVDSKITQAQLFKSGIKVGEAIMGPLINVLFLIFIADTITMSLLYLRNGNSWGYTFSMNMGLGMVQSLISGIGILLTIPLTSCCGAYLLGQRRDNQWVQFLFYQPSC